MFNKWKEGNITCVNNNKINRQILIKAAIICYYSYLGDKF